MQSKKLKVFYNFFNFNKEIYSLCKSFDFYDIDKYNKKFNVNLSWPGKRTQKLQEISPFLYIHVLSTLKLNEVEIEKYSLIDMHCHIRLKEDEQRDWPHEDSCDTALVYISPTNLDSGTKFFSDNGNTEICKISFLQNSCIFFETPLIHGSFGNHGDSIENARMTINVFMFK